MFDEYTRDELENAVENMMAYLIELWSDTLDDDIITEELEKMGIKR